MNMESKEMCRITSVRVEIFNDEDARVAFELEVEQPPLPSSSLVRELSIPVAFHIRPHGSSICEILQEAMQQLRAVLKKAVEFNS